MPNGGNMQPAIDNSEHIGPNDTGDNISAKRTAGYVWDSTTSTWVRGGGDLFRAKTILFASIAASASGDNAVVAAVTSQKIKVLSVALVSSGTVSVKWRSNTTDLSGAMPLAANSGFILPASAPGMGHYFETAAGQALNINLSGTVAVAGHISYYTE